jgi:hypothetical protein
MFTIPINTLRQYILTNLQISVVSGEQPWRGPKTQRVKLDDPL